MEESDDNISAGGSQALGSFNRFNQPDSIGPGAGDPRAWDRFAYVKNNPVVYSDPSGHRIACGDGEAGGCGGRTAESEYFRQRSEQRRCAAGNSSSCSYGQNHPVETAAFIVTGLVGAGSVGAAVAPAEGSAAALAKGAAYLEGANIACGGDMCSDEIGNIKAAFPSNIGQLMHIFRDDLGHLAEDTIANRDLLIKTITPENFQRINRFGTQIFARLLEDGTEVWVYLRDGFIRDGGVNITSKWIGQ